MPEANRKNKTRRADVSKVQRVLSDCALLRVSYGQGAQTGAQTEPQNRFMASPSLRRGAVLTDAARVGRWRTPLGGLLTRSVRRGV
jgi:hypothetical protein